MRCSQMALLLPLCVSTAAHAEEHGTLQLDAVYTGPSIAPLLGAGAIAGAQWRRSPWLSFGAELDFLNQSPLRTSLSLRAFVVAHHTLSFGGYGAVRLGTGYRHVLVHGDSYRVRDGRAERSTHAGFPLWSSRLEIGLGYDATRIMGWPIRVSIAPGAQVSLPQLDSAGVDLYITTRIAWTL